MKDSLDRLKQAQAQALEANARVDEAVIEARATGATWQQIGSILNISKQAASQRYGSTGTVYAANSLESIQKELNQLTEELFAALNHGDYERAHSLMTYVTARRLSKRKISDIWQQTLDVCGTFIEVHKTVTEYRGRDYVLTYRLRHALGEPVGQISFNQSHKITGLVIFNDDSTPLPW